MKRIALLVCALVLLSHEARTQPFEARGCVTDHSGGACKVLHAQDGRTYTLSGRKLPPAKSGAVVLVRGRATGVDTSNACVLRFIFAGGIAVKRWTFTRQACAF
ncbi:MAG: hypothetical protein WCE79_00760 [Xanthobacteraceae bacterium]